MRGRTKTLSSAPPLAMLHFFSSLQLCALFLTLSVSAAPASKPSALIVGTLTTSVLGSPSLVSAASPSPTVPLATDSPNAPAFHAGADIQPEPIRGKLGSTIIGPQNVEIDRQNPDFLAPPTTDNGEVCVVRAIGRVPRTDDSILGSMQSGPSV